MFTVKQAAEKLGVSQALIYALVSARKIRHKRHGLGRGAIRITEDALDEYRGRCTVNAVIPASEEDDESPPPVEEPVPQRKGPGIDLW